MQTLIQQYGQLYLFSTVIFSWLRREEDLDITVEFLINKNIVKIKNKQDVHF